MEKIEVYHVVTERPMELGQVIVMDAAHPNGVSKRVELAEKILRGEPATGELAEMLLADRERWAKVTYRELALEQVRRKEFPQYPSRLACLYTSRTLAEAESWAQFFQEIGRQVFSIVRLTVQGNYFDGDACNCFDGTEREAENRVMARHYWLRDVIHEHPVIETLVDGTIRVTEIMKQFR